MTKVDKASVRAYEEALNAARAELAEKRQQYGALGVEIGNLRQTVAGLKRLVGMDVTRSVPYPEENINRWMADSHLLPDDLDEVDDLGSGEATQPPGEAVAGARERPPATQPVSQRGRVATAPATGAGGRQHSHASSTERAALLLNELGQDMTIPEVVQEFRNRGWIEAFWTTPEAAVGQAVRRAHKLGLISRVDRRHYGPATSSPPSRFNDASWSGANADDYLDAPAP